MWSKQSSVLLSKGLIILGFIMTAIIIPFVPSCARFFDTISDEKPVWMFLTVIIYITLVFVVILLTMLFKLLHNISKEIVFVDKNTNLLRGISWCCFLIAFIYLVFGIAIQASFLVAFIAGFMGLILRILKNVFAEAVSIREENDYTI